jgi:hypothetical protein
MLHGSQGLWAHGDHGLCVALKQAVTRKEKERPMKFESLKPGMVVHATSRERMGHTMLKTVRVWTIKVLAVNQQLREVEYSLNGNRPTVGTERSYRKWRTKPPVLVEGLMGQKRIATRDELDALSLAIPNTI